ncbi:hypothetical protein [Microbulbifer sp. TYP-18]|uniref:hypothetical protein n=1 Tax=Microbulbifer sp. TYP-18 TaxID=3230024 RepID=UPI0034C5E5E1
MREWEKQYRAAVGNTRSPTCLDDQIFRMARRYKPVRQRNSWSTAAGNSIATMAVVAMLIHPAQYLGALTPAPPPGINSANRPWTGTEAVDHRWFALRSEVQAGNYIELCNQWRRQQRGSSENALPRDLEQKARLHCRILPTRR